MPESQLYESRKPNLQPSPAFNLGFHYGNRFRQERKDRELAMLEAWIRCTDNVDETEFRKGFYAGWEVKKGER